MKAIILFMIIAYVIVIPVSAQKPTQPKEIHFVVMPYDTLRERIMGSGCEVGLINCVKKCTKGLVPVSKEELVWFYQYNFLVTVGDSLTFISLELVSPEDEDPYYPLVSKASYNGYSTILGRDLWVSFQKSTHKPYMFLFKLGE